MFEETIEKKGIFPGPTSIILAGIHGDEVCGLQAFADLLPTLHITHGRVIFSYGNPKAIEAHRRYTQMNLNRLFKQESAYSPEEKESYEYTRASFLKPLLLEADALLDIHASHTIGSRPFVICEPTAMDIAAFLPVDTVVTGLDAVQPGGTDGFMHRAGKVGICVECGYIQDDSSTAVAKQAIEAFLMAQGHMVSDVAVRPHKQVHVHIEELYRTKQEKFVLTKEFLDFEPVFKDQVLGFDGETPIAAKDDGVILFARNRNYRGGEAFLFGKQKERT